MSPEPDTALCGEPKIEEQTVGGNGAGERRKAARMRKDRRLRFSPAGVTAVGEFFWKRGMKGMVPGKGNQIEQQS